MLNLQYMAQKLECKIELKENKNVDFSGENCLTLHRRCNRTENFSSNYNMQYSIKPLSCARHLKIIIIVKSI